MRHGVAAPARTLFVVAALAATIAVGCASDGPPGADGEPSASSVEEGTTTTSTPLPTPGVESAASVGLTVDGSCPAPWRPVYAGGTVYNSTPPPAWTAEVPPPRGPSSRQTPYDAPDTDGDGRPDVIGTTAEGAAILIERGDGEVVLALAGVTGFPGGRASEGDLDGDGRDDLIVFISPFTTTPRAEDAVVVVPGSVPPGSHDPRDVGVELFASGAPVGVVTGVGDQDGDGADDVAWDGEIVPGPALLAPGPGGRVTTRPSIGRFPEGTVGLLPLAEGRPPVAVSGSGSVAPGTAELTVHVEPEIVLETDRIPWDGGGVRPGAVSLETVDGHRYVWLDLDGGRSGTQLSWAWDLDDPCASPTPS